MTRTWLSTVLYRLQWLFAIPPTERQRRAMDEAWAEVDAYFASHRPAPKPAEKEVLH